MFTIITSVIFHRPFIMNQPLQVKRSIPRELIEAYEREQRRLSNEATSGSSPTKPKEPPRRMESRLGCASDAEHC